MEKPNLNPEPIAQKAVLSLDEVCAYTGYTRRYLLKLTSLRKIPYSKPGGKNIFFRRDELEAWLCRNRVKTTDELEAEAQSRTMRKEARR